MWTHKNVAALRTEPWVYVALPDTEIEYFQMHEPKDVVPRQPWELLAPTRLDWLCPVPWIGFAVLRTYRALKSLSIL